MMARLALTGLVAAALATSQAGCPAGPEPPPPVTGGLRVEGTPGDALVSVNDRLIGPIRHLDAAPMPLRPGPWRVEVNAPGYFAWYGEVEVADDIVTIRVDLRPIPP